MTFIIEAVKDDRHTADIRSSAINAVILARKLAADGFAVDQDADRESIFCRSVQTFADQQNSGFAGHSRGRLSSAARRWRS
jgi:hypothetical protein